ncbi:transmembrane protein, putative (macronuclear) [Tetrahymena thermophila SB210]|uniref:Transmembrane protein, putative n=1 Tax=Tetrahymena thermophila (strain SB210) TaxID=312017 RepID=W7XF79_TETTS|nr:transmembrane protein, putative [Tetrahymena thermophila SB210]EWS76457.1 transmembrane protein, putative [Tetrahymena thermophila SB210]|eukprot:XP_012651008.1 transmembrane protein, putative [Tetrahymena thermophila SB210]
MDKSYKDLIFDVLQNDVCEQQNSQIHFQNNLYFSYQLQSICKDPETKNILQNGVIGVINQYIHYGISLEEYIVANKFTNSQISQQQMLSILNSSIHIELITKGFLAPINSISTVINLFNYAFQDRSSIYLTAFKIYFLILLPFLTLITFLVIVVYTKNTQNDIVDINFTLTLIPYDKLLDENTINMLKQLRKYK